MLFFKLLGVASTLSHSANTSADQGTEPLRVTTVFQRIHQVLVATQIAKQFTVAKIVDRNKSVVSLMLNLNSDIKIIRTMFRVIENDTISNVTANQAAILNLFRFESYGDTIFLSATTDCVLQSLKGDILPIPITNLRAHFAQIFFFNYLIYLLPPFGFCSVAETHFPSCTYPQI